MGRHKKYTEVNDDGLAKDNVGTLEELGAKEGIEVVAEKDFIASAKLEAFMNEKLKIMVHPDTQDGSLEVIVPNVNAVNQPIIRGQECLVKRKYVEALARGRTTKYVQKVIDASKPENIQMEERTVLTYPFAVLEDPNSLGREWLQNIVAQP